MVCAALSSHHLPIQLHDFIYPTLVAFEVFTERFFRIFIDFKSYGLFDDLYHLFLVHFDKPLKHQSNWFNLYFEKKKS